MGRHINLFQTEGYKHFFTLTIDGVSHEIKEPVGFDKSDIVIDRDKDTHGVNYSMIDDSFRLNFDIYSGFKLIESYYNRHGSDGLILFEWSYIKDGVVSKKYAGNLNLNTYEIDDTYITCSVEKITFDSLFRTRYETKIDLNATKTLDGAPIAGMPPLAVSLHSKGLSKKFLSNTLEPQEYVHKTSRFSYIQMDTVAQTISEIDEIFAMPLDISGIDSVDADRSFFDVAEQGSYQFKSSVSFNITVGNLINIGNWSFVPRLIVVSAGDRRNIEFNDKRISGHLQGMILRTSMKFDIDIKLNLLPGDRVFYDVSGLMGYPGQQYNYTISNYTHRFEVFAQTLAPASTGNLYRYFDALNKAIEIVTGQENILRSSYFSEGGCGYRYAITNGFQLRNFDIVNRPVQVSIKELIAGMKSIINMGVAFSVENGKDVLVIEPMEDFYQDTVISHVTRHSEYREMTAKELIYNEVEVGYTKFLEDELLTLDEFNTYHTYLTPIKTLKNKLEIKSDFISSGYAIEKCRREQFSANPNTSLANDDEIFIISLNEAGTAAERSEAFDIVDGLYSADTAYNLRISPKRILFNWGRFINSGCFFKGQNEEIQNTFTKNNGDLVTKMKWTVPCSGNEPDGNVEMVAGINVITKALVKEKDNLKIKDLQHGERLWAPVWVTFKADMKWDEMYAIVRALTEVDHPHRYGFITFVDNNNFLQGGFPYTLTYNPATETCIIKCLKKLLTLPNGVDVSGGCHDYASWSFDHYEGNDFEEPIEDCTFDNFN